VRGRLADSAQSEPLLISQLVRMALWAILVPRLERVVNRAELTEAQLLALQQMLTRAAECPGLVRALVGEQTCGLGIFTDSQYQASLFGGANWGAAPTQGQRMRAVTLVSVLKTTGIFQKDKTVFLEVMATNVAAAELPYPNRLSAGRQAANLATTLPTRFCIFSRMLLPALGRTFDKDAEHIARLRTAETALAIESFRKAHGNNLPDKLQELVPAHLPCVPSDPYDGQPLRYKKLSPGYVVYSIGPDEKDDGGLEAAQKKGLARDVTFIINR
jgi:type II secretory pathway pseudopilin PulG